MKALILKELKSVFCSSAGVFFALAFLLTTGAVLWLFSGNYNFVDRGYADMGNFFWLASTLFVVLIPSLTMRLFSEEKRNKTFDVLISRPVSLWEICLSKFLSTYIFVITVLACTIIYVYSLYILAYPKGNIDINSIIASYVSLVLLAAVFISVGLFSSMLTKNQAVAFIIALSLSLFVFYGFDLFSGFFSSGKSQSFVSSLGLAHHYNLMRKGVVQLTSLLLFISYLVLFVALTLLFFTKNVRMLCFYLLSFIILCIVVNTFFSNVQFDFTKDKRYTLSNYTVNLLKTLDEGRVIEIDVFLIGDLNLGFQRLYNSVSDLLSEYNNIANARVILNEINPYQLNDPDIHEAMTEKGMSGIILNETDREGKMSRKVIYPYARINNGVDTLIVSFLKNISGNTAEENLSASMEGLEYEFTDAIRLLTQNENKSIAFLEGHDELPRAYVYDAEELLSKYYSVHRGQIGRDVGILDDFDAVIIAGPLKKYTEIEKYIIDQYIMQGGKVLWLIDGAFYSHQDLTATGRSASMKNELNLDDMLFSYGIRINPDLIQDKQCLSTYLIAGEGVQSGSVQPNYYQPILMPSPEHPITRNIRDVKSGFSSSIDVIAINSSEVMKNILLTSSANTHLVKVPEMIDFDIDLIQNKPDYFNEQFIPIAVSLEGQFNSAFSNRIVPDSVNINKHQVKQLSEKTKMVVVSSSDIVANEIQGKNEASQVLPMGYDRVSQTQYGNRDFILNTVNWLTGDDGLMLLRTKKQQMYLLDRKLSYEERDKYAVLNIVVSIVFMLLIMGCVYCYRKKKYEK